MPIPTAAVTTGTDVASAAAANQYFEFTVTASGGFQLQLTSLTFPYDTSYLGGIRGVGVRSGVDGYTADLLNYSEAAGVGTVDSYVAQNIDLSGAGFQNLSSINLRVYLFDGGVQSTSQNRVDTFVLNATVAAVPEPSSIFLLGSGLLVLWLLRRPSKRTC